nr:immunoglobulin light chain junction region [Macaca mulatta]MPN79955.1 immunoglobulin light chain junction region [Macaca mulatta]MPN80004.1 immunoglobulin light chain junction region [Macaca mulatta]MPN80120.1 immunoglobulin light chain junction region [Macaca mulatta]MPN80192.1 immunoglobulin light chain junction region [Macaca mulatta]
CCSYRSRSTYIF